MPSNPKGSSKKIEAPPTDDFKVIYGIGSGIETRLQDMGITTYAQLAALSPADLTALLTNFAGVSTERIIKQDWIGQARSLAAGQPLTQLDKPVVIVEEEVLEPVLEVVEEITEVEKQENPAELEAATEAESPALLSEAEANPIQNQAEPAITPVSPYQTSFIVALKLDDTNKVSQTYVRHTEGTQEETWEGWETERLLDFFARTAKIDLQLTQPAERIEAATPVETSLTNEPLAVISMRDIEVKADEPNLPSQILQTERPYHLQLTLDLSEVKVEPDTPIDYSLNIQGKLLGQGTRHTLSQSQGHFNFAEQVQLETKGETLPPGFYRLEASIKLALPTALKERTQSLETTARGGLFQVF